jgi:hypothetical protein
VKNFLIRQLEEVKARRRFKNRVGIPPSHIHSRNRRPEKSTKKLPKIFKIFDVSSILLLNLTPIIILEQQIGVLILANNQPLRLLTLPKR